MDARADEFVTIERGATDGRALGPGGSTTVTTTSTTARLAEIALPEIGMPTAEPQVPAATYADRMERLRAAMDARGYDHLVVWADREHSANIAYLTGFDPRFEEALLVVGAESEPAILVGNECYGMAGAAPLPMRVVLFQDLSLPGQPRDDIAAVDRHAAGRAHIRGKSGGRRGLEDVREP